VTPFVRQFHFPQLSRVRRPLGLWSYAWVSLHLAVWISLDLAFAWHLIGSEIIERSYILLGFSVWLMLSALAVTSVPRLVRAMGRRWKTLHRWIYAAAIAGCVHFWWSLKSGWIEPALYLAGAVALISLRRKVFLTYLSKRVQGGSLKTRSVSAGGDNP
jgi:methionine sulfoxide reductase heme-binding subunit